MEIYQSLLSKPVALPSVEYSRLKQLCNYTAANNEQLLKQARLLVESFDEEALKDIDRLRAERHPMIRAMEAALAQSFYLPKNPE